MIVQDFSVGLSQVSGGSPYKVALETSSILHHYILQHGVFSPYTSPGISTCISLSLSISIHIKVFGDVYPSIYTYIYIYMNIYIYIDRWLFPTIRGPVLGVPQHQDCNMSGSVIETPFSWKPPHFHIHLRVDLKLYTRCTVYTYVSIHICIDIYIYIFSIRIY